jgi:hypothetical protein
MKPEKRIRPLMSIREIFSIPRIFLIPAMLLSCVLFAMSGYSDSVSENTMIGWFFVAMVFIGLTSYMISFPFMHMGTLIRTGMDGTAKIIATEEQEETFLTPATATLITFEFTPQGTSTPIQLTAKVTGLEPKLQVGRMVKIRYAKTNPRIVKFDGE